MQGDLRAQRWVLISSYRRYLEADRAWTLAQRDAQSWFPASQRSKVATVGDPGSRVRRSYETREEALQRLLLVRAKLERARQRLEKQQRQREVEMRVLLLTG
mgnify:FL=1